MMLPCTCGGRRGRGQRQNVVVVVSGPARGAHVLHVLDALVELGRGADDGAADGDVVPVVELGGGLDDQVDAQLDRSLRRGAAAAACEPIARVRRGSVGVVWAGAARD